MGPPPPLVAIVVVVAPLKASTFSASEASDSGVADRAPSLSFPPRSLAKSAAATASQEEAGAGRVFIGCICEWAPKKLVSFFLLFSKK